MFQTGDCSTISENVQYYKKIGFEKICVDSKHVCEFYKIFLNQKILAKLKKCRRIENNVCELKNIH